MEQTAAPAMIHREAPRAGTLSSRCFQALILPSTDIRYPTRILLAQNRPVPGAASASPPLQRAASHAKW